MDIGKNVDTEFLNSQDEFVMMLQRNESLINRLCYALGDHSAYCTDELFQEVCIRLWRGWPGYKGIGFEKTWVYKVTLNTIRMEQRRKRSRVKLVCVDSKYLDSIAEEAANPVVADLYGIIDRLPWDERQLVYLYLDRLTANEIADITGKTETAVRQKIHRLMTKIKRKYENNKE